MLSGSLVGDWSWNKSILWRHYNTLGHAFLEWKEETAIKGKSDALYYNAQYKTASLWDQTEGNNSLSNTVGKEMNKEWVLGWIMQCSIGFWQQRANTTRNAFHLQGNCHLQKWQFFCLHEFVVHEISFIQFEWKWESYVRVRNSFKNEFWAYENSSEWFTEISVLLDIKLLTELKVLTDNEAGKFGVREI